MTTTLLLQGLALAAFFVLGVIATCIHKWDESPPEPPNGEQK